MNGPLTQTTNSTVMRSGGLLAAWTQKAREPATPRTAAISAAARSEEPGLRVDWVSGTAKPNLMSQRTETLKNAGPDANEIQSGDKARERVRRDD